MSDSVRPQRRQPTRLLRPWDSPGKNAGVGCHFLLQCMKVKSESEVAQSCPTLSNPMVCSLSGSSTHGIFQARILEWVAIAFSPGHLAMQIAQYELGPQPTLRIPRPSSERQSIQQLQETRPNSRRLGVCEDTGGRTKVSSEDQGPTVWTRSEELGVGPATVRRIFKPSAALQR